MDIRDQTDTGGTVRVFQTTHWTELLQLQTANENERRQQMGELLSKYWKPVYCYLRRKGHNSEDAKDLIQGFFQEIILGGHLVQRAQKSKGRFRTFLLTSLDHYVNNKHHYETAKKRRPAEGVIPLDSFDSSKIVDPDQNMSPLDAFNYAWASELLRKACNEVKEICCSSGKDLHWKVFQKKVLSPILDGTPVPGLGDICSELGVRDQSKASNMIGTVKRIFRSTMNRNLRQLVESDDQIDQEFNDLMEIFSRK